jgi:glycine hydroxymethyltransferase
MVAGFSAYSRIVDWQRFRQIADDIGAYFVADMAHVSGLVAAGLYPNPVPIADVTTTTTHKTLRGPRGGMILAPDNAALAARLDAAVYPGQQGGPLMHVVAAKAVALAEAAQPAFADYQREVIDNARILAGCLMERGYEVVTGGTDNHMLLVDLSSHGISGAEAERALEHVHIASNAIRLPGAAEVVAGLRLGTPAVTTRGLDKAEIAELAHAVADVLQARDDAVVAARVRAAVLDLCRAHPVYGPGL